MANAKRLLIMRHAKSSWAVAGISDHERPLNRRGERDAVQMAQFLVSQDFLIDQITASTAKRASQTAQLIVETIGNSFLGQLESNPDFYLAAPRTYLNYLRTQRDPVSTLMLIGHNPGLESLVQQLGGQWESMPTAAVACFRVSASSWSEAELSRIQLDNVWRPKDVLEHYL